MSFERYYEDLHDLIDSPAYIKEKKIVRLEGEIYDSKGTLQQEFLNRYSRLGRRSGGWARFDDGTIQEDG